MFLCDYDMLQAQRLVQGCDLWINTPLRPWEACGTSGMKILANGGLNLSELDGWWAEAYSPDIGWAIGDGKEHDGSTELDTADANALYALLENQIILKFYERNIEGIPVKWIARVRESMASLTPQFSANRAVREYTENFYIPVAENYVERAAAGEHAGLDLLQWGDDLALLWPHVHFGSVQTETINGSHHFSVQVYLGELEPNSVKVELYAEPIDDGMPVIETMTKKGSLVDSSDGYLYTATVEENRVAFDYTPRIVPFHRLARMPLEIGNILWQR